MSNPQQPELARSRKTPAQDQDADEVVCARTPEPFSAVGQWYVDFDQITDEEVCSLLRAGTGVATPPP